MGKDMTGQIERSIDELYRDDPERADALVFGRMQGPSRRGFLNGAGLAAMSAAVGGAIPFAANMPGGLIPAAMAQGTPPAPPPAAKGPIHLNYPGKSDKLVVIGERPLVAETPESLLDDETTPIDKFYIRNNGQIPDEAKEPDKWKFTVEGEVNKKLELTLGELKSKFKPQTRRMVLECGGNGRSFFTPQARGNQWTNGGAGCAEWTGVRLATVLELVGTRAEARYVVFEPFANPNQSGRVVRVLWDSIDMADALHSQTLLAYIMNGEALPVDHGAPVRLRLSRHLGYKNTKYLSRIIVSDRRDFYRKSRGTWYGGI